MIRIRRKQPIKPTVPSPEEMDKFVSELSKQEQEAQTQQHEILPPRYVCKYCGAVFNDALALGRHVRMVHSLGKPEPEATKQHMVSPPKIAAPTPMPEPQQQEPEPEPPVEQGADQPMRVFQQPPAQVQTAEPVAARPDQPKKLVKVGEIVPVPTGEAYAVMLQNGEQFITESQFEAFVISKLAKIEKKLNEFG